METYCVSCKKYTGNESSRVRKTKRNIKLLSNCAASGKKKSTFIKTKKLHNFD